MSKHRKNLVSLALNLRGAQAEWSGFIYSDVNSHCLSVYFAVRGGSGLYARNAP